MSLVEPNSSIEHIMPQLSTPLNFPFLISIPPFVRLPSWPPATLPPSRTTGTSLSLFYVRGTCHNLNLFTSDINLADDELIRIRMLFNLFNLADDDLIQILVQPFIILPPSSRSSSSHRNIPDRYRKAPAHMLLSMIMMYS